LLGYLFSAAIFAGYRRRDSGNPRNILVPESILNQNFCIGFLLSDCVKFFGSRRTQHGADLHIVDVAIVKGVRVSSLKRQHHLRHTVILILVTRSDSPKCVALND